MTRRKTRLLSLAFGVSASLAVLPALAQDSPTAGGSGKACLAPATWYALTAAGPVKTASAELLADMARRDVLLLGEQHDDADDHRWQLQTLAALHLFQPRMVIGFESFPRRVQPVLDKWIAGELSERQFLEQTEWAKVWGLPAPLYLPLFHFARMNRIPVVALNVERELTRAITLKGWDGVPEAQKEGISRPAPASRAYRDFLFTTYKAHPRAGARGTGQASPTDQDFLNFVDSQTTWDRGMAEALARSVRSGPGDDHPLVVGIVGSGHVRDGYGVPHQLRALGITDIGTLLRVDAAEDCGEMRQGLADAVFAAATETRDRPPKPRLGVRIDDSKDSVTIIEVSAGSLAETTGLKPGDRVVMLAGSVIAKNSEMIAIVGAQPAGTWLPIQVRRGDTTLDLVIKFPSAQ
jgi:uncharacterized iron-regulated protein